MARCMMKQSKLPVSFWAEAVATANYIRNRCITNVLKGKTPFEAWHGRRPNVEHLRIFGETAFMLDKTPGKGKLDPRGIKCTFLGYDEPSRSFRVWVPSRG
ncbi:Copia protein [Cyphomyrmex costatus]|uniref:Copia protein n=1 Tax=Cyphomyrmex costatus TaxID=456900 RepID=A0A151I9F2_9HYME|nr:Copia protein [Cyphomyrmex costatus]